MSWYSISDQQVDKNDKEKETESVSISLKSLGSVEILKDPLSQVYIKYDPREFICGWGAAFINITVTYPIYKLIFRQMLHNLKAVSAFQELRHEGIRFLYRGMLPPLCQKTASLSMMFGIYEEVRRPLAEASVAPIIAKTVGGMIAGSAEALLMPFERIQTLLQDRKYHSQFSNTRHAFQVIGLEHGVREYYRGLTPILLRNGPSNVMFFVLRDEVKDVFSQRSTWIGQLMQEFVAGACIGAFLSTVFYPLNVLKVHVQSGLGGPFDNCWKVFVNLCREKGWKSMYRGVHLNYTRAFISWGVINASYEFMKKLLY